MHPQSAILSSIFIWSLLLLSSYPNRGYGRDLGVMIVDTETVKYHDVAIKVKGLRKQGEEEVVVVMDYNDPGANTNPRNGFLVPPSAPSPPPYPFSTVAAPSQN